MMGRSTPWNRRDVAYAIVVAVLAFVVAAPAIANGFAYDDLPIVQNNPRVTESRSLWLHLHQGYWPGQLYRPLTVWMLSLQWHAANGAPWLFHLVNALLIGAVCALVYRVARAWFAPPLAFVAAALFAVHPVHVEAVANVVGQGELLASLGVLLAIALLLGAPAEGPSPARRGSIALIGACAAMAKENAFMLPVLLALAGVFGSPERRLTDTWKALKPTLLLTTGVVIGILILRTAVLGAAVGELPAVALRHLSFSQRLVVMLGVVPEWTRLLFWPAHLQTEYGPPEVGLPVFAWRQLVGIASLGLLLLLGWWCRRREPAVTFGVLWIAFALAPVSNVLVATGIVLAERTLFLPSVGAVIAVAGLGAMLLDRVPRRATQVALASAAGVLVLLAGWRSAHRARIWDSNQTVFTTGVLDAPRSYRAWRMLGLHMQTDLRWDASEEAFRRSLRLWGGDPSVYEGLGLALVQHDRCTDAIPILQQGIALDSTRSFGFARLYFCQRKAGDWAGAYQTAAGALNQGDTSFARLLRAADSALIAQRSGSAASPELQAARSPTVPRAE